MIKHQARHAVAVLGFLAFLFNLGATAHAQPIQVTDSTDRIVRLTQPAQRVVALAPHIVENIFSAGAGRQLVGVVSFSNYPAAAKQIPVVGSYHAFSLEKIIALQPDLIVTWAEGNGEDAAKPFEALGIPVYVDEPRKLQQVATSVRNLGILTGNAEIATRNADQFEQSILALQARYQQADPVSVFYQVWNKPLQTVNNHHIISAVIELCGGRNIFVDTKVLAPKISIEAVLARDPEVIIASGMDRERPEWLDEWRGFPHLQAVQNDNLYFIPPDILQRHTVRLLQGAERMCEYLATARQHRRDHLPASSTEPNS